jgi:16S rRNA (guanine1207-N2)-methyltransferase
MSEVHATIRGVSLSFETAPTLFSPRAIDPGTLAMLSRVTFAPGDKILDLGCGYGVVGILAAKLIGADCVHLLDSDPLAVATTLRNARANGVEGVHVVLSDGLDALDTAGFTQILCNPPYHVDFAVPKRFIHKGFNRLAIGGRFWLVAQRDDWYRNKLRSIFGGVTVHDVAPYRVFEAIKRSSRHANAA